MQRGKVKYWNQKKGYGFIRADNQNEDVFFHISQWQIAQPPKLGLTVYFNTTRNHKNQPRAIQVTTSPANSTLPSINFNPKPDVRKQQKFGGIAKIISTFGILLFLTYLGITALKPELLLSNDSNLSSSTTNHTQISSTSTSSDPQIEKTIALIRQGGPFPYPHKDGTIFYNREGKLPSKQKGYYHEYTVPTPGLSHRGPRRIVTGGNPPVVYYFTADHYQSFTKLTVESSQ